MDEEKDSLEKLMEEVGKIGLGDAPEIDEDTMEADAQAVAPESTGTELVATPVPAAPIPEMDDDASENIVNNEVINSMKDLISQGLSTIKTIKPSIENAIDWKELTAYNGLIKATSDAIGVLNKLNIENKKAKAAKKLKAMELSNRKGNTTNNLFIGSREEALKLAKSPPKQIEGDSAPIDVPTN